MLQREDDSDQVFIVHAAAGNKTETFCREFLAQDKSVLTIDRPENRSLLDLGVEALAIKDVRQRWPPSVEPKQTGRKEKT